MGSRGVAAAQRYPRGALAAPSAQVALFVLLHPERKLLQKVNGL
jgi:hypothetical protein